MKFSKIVLVWSSFALGGCGFFGDEKKEELAEPPAAVSEQKPQYPSYKRSIVMKVQKELNAQGFHAGPVDGIYGPQTARAVRAFQEMSDLRVTGRLNGETVNAIEPREEQPRVGQSGKENGQRQEQDDGGWLDFEIGNEVDDVEWIPGE